MTKKNIVHRKWVLFAGIVVLALFTTSTIFAASYYVSSTHPDRYDDGQGTETQPWATIQRVNQHAFEPGDTIKFKRGDTWNLYEDEGLKVWYSGSETAKIEYTCYGEATDPPPLFNGGKEFRSSSYQWTQSNGASNEYYLEAAGGGSANFSNLVKTATVAVKPSNPSYYPVIYDADEDYYLLYNPYQPAEEFYQSDKTPGTLVDDMWGWGNHESDALISDTIYIRCDDGDPDEIFSSIMISQHFRPAISIDAWEPIAHIEVNHIELRHIGRWALRILRAARNIEINNVVCKFNHNGIDAWGNDSCSSENDQWGNKVNNCYLTQNTMFGIAAFGCGSFDNVYNNECRYNHKYGIFVTSKHKTYVVEGNDIHHNGIEHKRVNPQYAYWGLEVVQNSQNHYPIVRYNSLHHNTKVDKWCGDGGGINIRADNAQVYYNLSYLNDGPGIGGGHMEVDDVHFGAKIYNNVSYSNCQGIYTGCAELKFKDIEECTFRNNIVQRDPASLSSLLVRIDNPFTMVLSNNCYYSPDGAYNFWWGSGDPGSCDAWLSATGEGSTSFCADPQFANVQYNDFRITSDSPGIDEGYDAWLTEDHGGNPVPYNTLPDIGAYEFSPGPRILDPNPGDGITSVSTELTELRFTLYDPDGDLMDYTVTTNPDCGSIDVTGVTDGTYSVAVSGLDYDTTYQWEVSVTDGNEVTSQSFSFTTGQALDSWWNSDWSSRKVITVDADQVDATLSDFPLLIDFTDDYLAEAAHPDGDDIIFIGDDGTTILNYEIESYYDTTGSLIAWVQVPILSSTTDTVVYMYYGNPDAASQENPQDVWDNNYVMVQHLDETEGTHYDSTAYANHGIPLVATQGSASGPIGGADEFDGVADHINCGSTDSLDIAGSMTVEAWAYSDNGTAVRNRIVSKDMTGVVGKFIFWENYAGDLAFIVADPDSTWYRAQGNSVTNGVWMHVVGVYDADNEEVRLYQDGIEIVAVDGPASLKSSTETVTIGASDNNDHNWKGILDEVRISDVARSPEWISASYQNITHPSSFYRIRSEEIATCTSDEDCGLCEMCEAGSCIAQPASEDFKEECTGGICVTGLCDGAGNCGFKTSSTICRPSEGECDVAEYCTGISPSCPGDVFEPDGTSCDDEIYCNGDDTCAGGTCVEHSGNPCTDDGLFCNGTENCNESGKQCFSSGDPCTAPQICDEGSDDCVTADSGDWWNSDWDYRKPITVDASQVDVPLTNFPMLVDVTDNDLAAAAQPDGDDIVFTDINGIKLSHEIELYDDFNGHLIAWVNIPNLSSTEDTTVYLYFGSNEAGSQESPGDTWNNNYVMVQHLEETSETHLDSTSNSNDGTAAAGTDQDAQGIIQGADEFDGIADYVNCGSNATLDITGSMTVEAWAYSDNGTAEPNRIVAKDMTGVVGKFIFWKNDSGNLEFMVADPGSTWFRAQGSSVTNGRWMHVAGVYDAQSRQVKLYRDGVEVTSIAGPALLKSNTETVTIGASDNNDHNWKGILDEVRISNVSRSAGWIAASYSNQNNPEGFYSIGSLELFTRPVISGPSPADGATNVSVALTELRFTLSDPGGDPMDCTVTTTPNIGSDYVTGVTDGTYSMELVSELDYETTYQWNISVTDGSGITIHSYSFTTEKALESWWNSDWGYRKPITVDASQVDVPLINFPLLVDVTDDDLAAAAQPDGDDIVFTDINGIKLSHEIELYDDFNGHLIAWVNIPNLSSTEDTTVYLYFGSNEAGSQENPGDTWNNNYVMVQHLEEISGSHFDSSGSGNDGTATVGTNQDTQGVIQGADGFDGTAAHINCGSAGSLDITGSMTVEAWVYSENGAATPQRIAAKDRTGVVGKFIFWENGAGNLAFIVADPGSTWYRAQGNSVTNGTWMHVVGVYDAQSRQVRLYRDGIEVSAVAGPSSLKSNTENLTIGASDDNDHNWNGIIDEVRISNVSRSAGWIQTSYSNQEDPLSFVTIGDLEIQP